CDVYYHSDVYNAYAAALLLFSDSPTDPAVDYRARSQDLPAQTHLKDAGIYAVRAPRFFAAFTTRGQCVLPGSSLFCDMRYAGLQPLLVEIDGKPVIPEPPLHWSGPANKQLAVSPQRIGFTPIITWRS